MRHPIVDTQMVITRPSVPRAQILNCILATLAACLGSTVVEIEVIRHLCIQRGSGMLTYLIFLSVQSFLVDFRK